MPDYEPDFVLNAVRETAERDVEKRVYERIKGDLLKLKFFGAGAAVIFLIVALFHQQIFAFVVSQGAGDFKKQIEEQIKGQKAILVEAEVVRGVIQTQVRQYLDEVGRQQSALSKLGTDFEKQQKELTEKIVELNTTLHAAQEAKAVIDQRLQNAQSAAQDAARRIGENAEQLNEISKTQSTILSELKSRNILQPTVVADVIKQATTAAPRPTVYFQFAGFTREMALEISKEIEKFKWTIPGQERTSLAADPKTANRIRYNRADRADAEQLQKDANDALAQLKLNISLVLEQNTLVKQGILEVWVYQN
jgi:cell division septum initiation protein DivIVA